MSEQVNKTSFDLPPLRCPKCGSGRIVARWDDTTNPVVNCADCGYGK